MGRRGEERDGGRRGKAHTVVGGEGLGGWGGWGGGVGEAHTVVVGGQGRERRKGVGEGRAGGWQGVGEVR